MASPILSICIPTYNRSGYLYYTLKSIVEQEIFQNTNDVEIIISDNCSSDLTEKISRIFVNQYPEKIIYCKNDQNIGVQNIEKALSLGNGEVLKLHGDNFVFKENSLSSILQEINKQRDERNLIFFANGLSPVQKNKLCKNQRDFLAAASYLSLWMTAFSIWKDDLTYFKDFSKSIPEQFMQANVLFKLNSFGRKISVFNNVLFEEKEVLNETKINVIKLYGKDYLDFLKQYFELGTLNKIAYEEEKKTLFFNYIIPMRFLYSNQNTFNPNKTRSISDENYWDILYSDYWKNLYFYTSVFKILKLMFKTKLKSLIQRFDKNYYQEYWRNRNPHNSTTIVKGLDISKIFVGKNVKGLIDVKFSSNPNDLLIIDDGVEIGEDVKFAFGIKDLIIVKNDTIIKKGSVITR